MLLPLVVLLFGCGPTHVEAVRNAPSPRANATESIIGHWSSDSNDHLYYDPIDPSSHRGTLIMIQGSRPNRPFHHEYEIVDGTEVGITLRLHFESGTVEERYCRVDQTGKTLTEEWIQSWSDETLAVTYARVDDKIAPPAE